MALDGGEGVVIVVQVAEKEQTVHPFNMHGELLVVQEAVWRVVELLMLFVCRI